MQRTMFSKIAYCLCGDQAIFLDVGADRYFTLPASQNRAFLLQLKDSTDLSHDGSAAARILVESAEPCRNIAPPTHSATGRSKTRANPLWVVRTALAYIADKARLKRRGLAHVLQLSANRRQSRPQASAAQTYDSISAAFAALEPVFGKAENCLPRSIAFHALARAGGHAPSLVIGVKRDPFAAHCWVQDGNCVLNDSAEHVRIFTPILVI